VIDLAKRLDATLPPRVRDPRGGSFPGEYTEDDFDVAQDLRPRIHQTKFEAEMLVRSAPGLRMRIYGPPWFVGDSRTGENGQGRTARTTSSACSRSWRACRVHPIVLPDTGRTNSVPSTCMDALHRAQCTSMGGTARPSLTAPKTTGLRGNYPALRRGRSCRQLRGSCRLG